LASGFGCSVRCDLAWLCLATVEAIEKTPTEGEKPVARIELVRVRVEARQGPRK
jgi:hypothetical protein